MKITTYIIFAAAVGITMAQAQPVLTPAQVQQPDMKTLLSGKTNLGLLSNGATAQASTWINGYEAFHVIDGLLNQTPYPWGNEPTEGTSNNPWIPPDHPSPPDPQFDDWVLVDFTGTNAAPVSNIVGIIAVEGRYAGRAAGTYTLNYTTDAPPIVVGSDWITIGTFTWASSSPLPYFAFEFPAISNVTGIELVSSPDFEINGTNAGAASFWANSIQQLQSFTPFSSRPTIVTQPQNTNVFVFYPVELEIAAAGGTAYQWYKNNTLVSGATSNTFVIPSAQIGDSGTYSVLVSNLVGSVTSGNAVVNVTIPPLRVLTGQAASIFAWTNVPGYTYAVQGSVNATGPWTTITNWTVNVGNLVETAIPKASGYSYFQLTLTAHP